ncbi:MULTISPECIES: metallophosphoesterase [Thermoanaerobacterium]|uniref:Phosphoesterase n=1 Tax=Thermoanaerobacterium butyriciformans TaxID=1702242 RepID=A0ABS4NBU3_9THEO|nr:MULTISPECIES: metallophosphoesterase [Thermoanaerobacterium]MBP2071133.1 putative phosphoesterase [Thermoanaerobacterium butyriciformans]MCP2239090.1 putative phosphoesterase [Thermoanaerobacterium thermosaccharolyticum]
MRLFVTSDTHGMIQSVRNILKNLKNIDYIIHLGDYYRDAIELNREFGIPTLYVYGNCDFGDKEKYEKIIDIDGRRILLTHGHKYYVKFEKSIIIEKAREYGVDAVFYGHTHVPLVYNDGDMIVLNPGSPSMPREGSSRTVSIVNIENGIIVPQLLNIDDMEQCIGNKRSGTKN